MYFSLLVERKVPKEAPRKESTHGTFLTDPIALSARHFTKGEMATRCKVAVCRVAEVSATWPTTSGSLPV